MTEEEIKAALLRYTEAALVQILKTQASQALSIVDWDKASAFAGDRAAKAAVAAVKGNIKDYEEIVNQS